MLFSKIPKNEMCIYLHVCYVLGEDADEEKGEISVFLK